MTYTYIPKTNLTATYNQKKKYQIHLVFRHHSDNTMLPLYGEKVPFLGHQVLLPLSSKRILNSPIALATFGKNLDAWPEKSQEHHAVKLATYSPTYSAPD